MIRNTAPVSEKSSFKGKSGIGLTEEFWAQPRICVENCSALPALLGSLSA